MSQIAALGDNPDEHVMIFVTQELLYQWDKYVRFLL